MRETYMRAGVLLAVTILLGACGEQEGAADHAGGAGAAAEDPGGSATSLDSVSFRVSGMKKTASGAT